MVSFSYSERDYAFGQRMLALRTGLGLTQSALADLLGVSRRAVGAWEGGVSYPKAEHLQHFIVLLVRRQVLPVGRETEEIRALWRVACQKVLLNEHWLATLLCQEQTAPPDHPPQQLATTSASLHILVHQTHEPCLDWGEALALPTFYGREEELALLTQWVIQERCRLVSVLGIGGVGKSALAVHLMHQIAAQFEVVIFRSLRDAPPCETLLEDCLQTLSPQLPGLLPVSLERRIGLLLEQMRQRRALVVLDNLETLLEEGVTTGRFRSGFEGYERLLRRVAETETQSCLLLTSREKPAVLRPLEGKTSPVRSLSLDGLQLAACGLLLADKDVVGTSQDQARLIEAYAGNPLALKIVSGTIVDLFGGNIDPFLEEGEIIFGNVAQLLSEQYCRLSTLEQTVLCWLAILREPVTIEELMAVLPIPPSRSQMLEAIDSLRRRSLIERGQRSASFTLQSVVLEYATSVLIEKGTDEILQGRLERLLSHGLAQAQAREYVRQTQERLLVAPLLACLQNASHAEDNIEQRLADTDSYDA